MKQWFRTVLAGALLAGSLTVAAAAANYTACAEHLKDLGLFEGTAQGYELDRAPTRGEAVAMLVRLLGAEQNALTLEYSAPFTDLQNWEKPYVRTYMILVQPRGYRQRHLRRKRLALHKCMLHLSCVRSDIPRRTGILPMPMWMILRGKSDYMKQLL